MAYIELCSMYLVGYDVTAKIKMLVCDEIIIIFQIRL